MTRDQLESQLEAMNVHPSNYSLDGIRHNDCVCIVNEEDQWKVFYVERDKPKLLGEFGSAEEAYDFTHETFRKWLGK